MEKYKNPVWQDRDRPHLVCEMLQTDGNYSVCHIVAGPEEEGVVNEDYEAIMSTIGLEQVEENTRQNEAAKELHHQKMQEENELKLTRAKQEVVFNMKLEAFEIDAIRNSEDKDMKKLIRKAKTPLEVSAYATILIQRELEKNA